MTNLQKRINELALKQGKLREYVQANRGKPCSNCKAEINELQIEIDRLKWIPDEIYDQLREIPSKLPMII